MTEDEATRIAKKVAKETAHEILTQMGIDMDEPFDMQRDFQYVRSLRLSTEAVKRQGIMTAVIVVVGSLLGALWLIIKGGGGNAS